MAAFLGDIAFLFGVVVAAAGLFTLHRAGGDPRPALLKTAGILLLAAGIGTAVCTSYYYLKYHFSGDLEHPWPAAVSGKKMKMMMGEMGGMQMDGMMGGKAPDRPRGAPVSEPATEPADVTASEHEEHHPAATVDEPR